jgi:D-galactose 1-dehydrogenase
MAIKLGIVGIGKIARDQHLPVVARSQDFDLCAVASRNAQVAGVPSFRRLSEMLDATPELAAVSLCTPPVGRADDARLALSRGLPVMLEKPPAATLAEAHELIALSEAKRAPLFFTWHSRHAASVPAARRWLSARTIRHVRIAWMEDIRVWHPGQDWILEPGGLGVFDPAINALSIVTDILPEPFSLKSGSLVFPENRQAPIAARLEFRTRSGAVVEAELDFLHEGRQRWDIDVQTDGGELRLTDGGAHLTVDGEPISVAATENPLHGEYEALYRRFAQLIRTGESEVDLAPLRHVADAFLLSRRTSGPRFDF